MTWRRSAGSLLLLAILAPAAAGCGGGGTQPHAELVPLPEDTQQRTTPPTGNADGARGSEDARASGQLTVHVTRTVRLRARPGGRVVGRLTPRTGFRSATVVPVVRVHGAWLGVVTTGLPNGRLGWIRASPALVAYRTRYRIDVSLRHRRVVVRRGGHVMLRFPIAVGSPSTPTPTGRFAVTDKLFTNDPGSPYGCCILALSARQQRTPQGWGGGDRVAIHATNLPETIGTAASLGCMRGPADEVRRAVRTVPLGTIVRVRA